MSSATPDLVEVVNGLFQAAERGDWDALISQYAPGAVWETDDGILDVAGAADVRALLEEWTGTFDDWRIQADPIVDLGNGIIYSVFHQEGRLAGSTAVVAETGSMIYEWVEGMIARVITRQDIDEGRALAERLVQERG